MTSHFRLTLGDRSIVVLSDGGGPSPLAPRFPRVPAGEVNALAQALGYSTETIASRNVLLVEGGARRILIDAGLPTGPLVDSLAAAGYAPDDIDAVVITHGDGDHVGGLSRFTRAHVYLPRRAWELWTGAETHARMVDEWAEVFADRVSPQAFAGAMAGRRAYGQAVLPGLGDRLTLVDEAPFLPGWRFIAAPGHRSDHFAVEIRAGGAVLLHVADALSHPIQAARPDWTGLNDTYPEQAAVTNRMLLEHADGTGAILFCTHMAFPGLARLSRGADGWRMSPIVGNTNGKET